MDGRLPSAILSALRSLYLQEVQLGNVPMSAVARCCPNLRDLWFGGLWTPTAAWQDLRDISAFKHLERLACVFQTTRSSPDVELPPSLRHLYILDYGHRALPAFLHTQLSTLDTLVVYECNAESRTHPADRANYKMILQQLRAKCKEDNVQLWVGSHTTGFPDVAYTEAINGAVYNCYKRGELPPC